MGSEPEAQVDVGLNEIQVNNPRLCVDVPAGSCGGLGVWAPLLLLCHRHAGSLDSQVCQSLLHRPPEDEMKGYFSERVVVWQRRWRRRLLWCRRLRRNWEVPLVLTRLSTSWNQKACSWLQTETFIIRWLINIKWAVKTWSGTGWDQSPLSGTFIHVCCGRCESSHIYRSTCNKHTQQGIFLCAHHFNWSEPW